MVQSHRCLKIIVFIVIISDSYWFCKSRSFSHSVKATSLDHIAILADSNQPQLQGVVWLHYLNMDTNQIEQVFRQDPCAETIFSGVYVRDQ